MAGDTLLMGGLSSTNVAIFANARQAPAAVAIEREIHAIGHGIGLGHRGDGIRLLPN